MTSPSPMSSSSTKGVPGRQEQYGQTHVLVFFVSTLREFNSPRYRGQNGWVKEGWNAITDRMNEKFTSTKFVVSQLKDREQRLKKDYNAVTLLLSKSGFGWDHNLNMATTLEGNWSELPENLQKFKDKSFPYYNELDKIYNGKVAGGKHCRRTSEKTERLNTPSPTLPVSESAWTDFFQDDITHSQYRAMADRQTYNYNQFSASMDQQAKQEAQAEREAQAAKERRPKKCKRNNETSMDELIALRREELEVYKDLTERQLQLKQRKIEKCDPNNDPFSMTKRMEKLKTFSFSQQERVEAIKFLKGDREAREIFIGCDEIDLADAYIRGSIAP